MRQAIWCTILTFSTAKLYKGARVAYKFLQVVSNRANIMVTYPNQQNFVASLTSSVNEWHFASSHRTHASQIASHRVSHRKKASVNPASSGIHSSFFAMRHAMRQARNRENPKSQPCRTPLNCRNWAIAGHRRS